MTVVASRKKRWFKALGLVILGIVVVALALPVWFPWVLRPVLAQFGVRFGSYERLGYTRFALTGVRANFGNTRFNSDRIAGLLPPRWLWRRYSRNAGGEPFLTIAWWDLQIEPEERRQPGRAPTAPGSTFAVAEQISRALPVWRTWLPAAQLTGGRVGIGANEVKIAAVEWHRGKLTATVESLKP